MHRHIVLTVAVSSFAVLLALSRIEMAAAQPETLFGDLGFDMAIPHLDLQWPPLKSIPVKYKKPARSIFVATVRHDTTANAPTLHGAGDSASWLSKVGSQAAVEQHVSSTEPLFSLVPMQERAILKVCPPPASECVVEAWAHRKATLVTRCADSATRCSCTPHFVPIYEAWNARPLPIEAFHMPLSVAKSNSEYK